MARFVMPLIPQPCHQRLQRAGRALALLASLLAGIGCSACDAGPAVRPAGTAAELKRGQRLLEQYQCGSCHAIPGVAAARGVQGPSLEAFGRRSYIAGQVPNGPDSLVRWIVAPQALVPGTLMPSMGVSPADARFMAAYLESLR